MPSSNEELLQRLGVARRAADKAAYALSNHFAPCLKERPLQDHESGYPWECIDAVFQSGRGFDGEFSKDSKAYADSCERCKHRLSLISDKRRARRILGSAKAQVTRRARQLSERA